ncbi:hypothetical protein [Cohnella abietis]|uniref:Uncharacterized protein n=1 Tax=Cohnella abietis TaxID=2507935 RepID=A0A3T1D6J1_9BACL|nr:hypothetical protein [Cohnella abietis]BBI33681.1 hypothetical protein KCTCHS21_30800 [Cohnella abietis]
MSDSLEDIDGKRLSASLPLSFKQLRLVSQAELSSRLEAIKVLSENTTELYRLVKDTATGDHYLHYAVFHIHVAGGGVEEEYHHLLPMEHDDVIAVALGAPLFEYPHHWKHAYLRNGPHGGFVWYDPSGVTSDEAEYAEAEAYIREQLLAFHRQTNQGEEDVKRLLEAIDKHLPPPTEQH